MHYVSLCGGGVTTRLILADVSGHGASVADLAQSLRNLMRRNINHKNQTKLVQKLNRQFAELATLSRFATAVVATYLTKGDKLTICNAGHPPGPLCGFEPSLENGSTLTPWERGQEQHHEPSARN